MAASRFTEENRATLLELFAAGCSVRDAAKAAGINEKTVKTWITRGNKEDSGTYAEFALRVRECRLQAEQAEEPMTEDELRLAVSRAARKGNVQAQKLYWEMLRATDDDDAQEPKDGFEALDQEDELAAKRESKRVG